MSSNRVCVVGAINVDLVIDVDEATVTEHYANGSHFATLTGGKGLNTALSLAALDPDATGFVGRVGADIYGSFIESAVKDSALEAVEIVRDNSRHTGVGHVRVHANRDYDTVVLPGANEGLCSDDVKRYVERYPDVTMWVTNLETPLGWLDEAGQLAPDAPIAINISPVNHLVDDALSRAHLVVMNELEARLVSGVDAQATDEGIINGLRKLTSATIVVTAGERGAFGAEADGDIVRVDAVPTTVATTVGAGDSFFAALCLDLSRGRPLVDALHSGARAGAAVASSVDNFLTSETMTSFIDER